MNVQSTTMNRAIMINYEPTRGRIRLSLPAKGLGGKIDHDFFVVC